MRKIVVPALLALCLSGLWADGCQIPFVSADVTAVDALWGDCLQTRIDVGLRIADDFGLRIPLTFVSDTTYAQVSWIDSGLFFDYRPFSDGFFCSVSLFEIGRFFGMDRPDEARSYLNEIAFGFTWHVTNGLYLEPRLLIRDPSGVFEDSYDTVSTMFPDYSMVRFSCSVGWDFPAVPVFGRGDEESCRQEGGTAQ
jgi:hypothetical protein